MTVFPTSLLERLTESPRHAPSSAMATVEEAVQIDANHIRLVLHSPNQIDVTAGQFFMLGDGEGNLPGEFRALPRPMALYDLDQPAGRLSFLVQIIGKGTRQLAHLSVGDRLRLIGPLGHGFDLSGVGPILLLGRGVGAFSLGLIPQQARSLGRKVHVVLSAAAETALTGAEHFTQNGCRPITVTDEAGDSAVEDLRSRLLAEFNECEHPALVISCGSRRLRALSVDLAKSWSADVQTSIEANMACGLGYCHGCAADIPSSRGGRMLVCADGPAFRLVATQDGHLQTPASNNLREMS